MDLDEAIKRRRMCRNYLDRHVDPIIVDRLLDRARRAPSAGFTQGWSFLVLEGVSQTAAFWEAFADDKWRAEPTLPGLMRAPVVVVPFCSPARYLARYSEPDKVAGGFGEESAWAVPYWTVDVSFATMLLLLGAVEEGLGALFFGRRAADYVRLRASFGVPDEWQPIGAVLIGWPAGDWGPRGSAGRGRRELAEIVHRGAWSGPPA